MTMEGIIVEKTCEMNSVFTSTVAAEKTSHSYYMTWEWRTGFDTITVVILCVSHF